MHLLSRIQCRFYLSIRVFVSLNVAAFAIIYTNYIYYIQQKADILFDYF